MKKALSYLYREILLKVNEELTKYYSDEYEEDEDAKFAIDTFRKQLEVININDVNNFDEELCHEIFKETKYETWIGDRDIIRDVISEFRESGEEMDDKVEQGRHYCSQEVAKEITGTKDLYLAWTYYFGGGKHSQPEEVEWMEDCYLVKAKEQVKFVKIYEKIDDTN